MENTTITDKSILKDSDVFWSEDITILMDDERVIEFIPTSDMSLAESLNAIARFGVYLGVIISLYRKEVKFMLISVIIAIFTIIIYKNSKYTQMENFEKENLEISECQKPTSDNPYMNLLPSDYYSERCHYFWFWLLLYFTVFI